MTTQERMMEVAKLRLRFRMNSRLRLESLAMLSRLFREHQEPIADELLSSLVFAVPEELMGSADEARATLSPELQNPPSRPTRPGRAHTSEPLGGQPHKVPPGRPPRNPPPRPHGRPTKP